MSEERPYTLRYSRHALVALKRLDKTVARRIVDKAEWLASNAMIVHHKALSGRWHGLFKWRVGENRIIYSLDHKVRVLSIEEIGNRSDIYDE